MKDYGTVKSTVRPDAKMIDECSVWVHSNIAPVEEIIGEETFTGFTYNKVQYDKDEYIKIMDEKNSTLEAQLTDTQLALVEIYESLVVM